MGLATDHPVNAKAPDVAIFAGDRREIIYVQSENVDVVPPDPLGELGSGWAKIQSQKSGVALPVVR